jgi:uncharacterized LabA/DUF88 family protein
LKYAGENRENVVNQLTELGIESRARSNGQEISVMLTSKELAESADYFIELLTECEKKSKE